MTSPAGRSPTRASGSDRPPAARLPPDGDRRRLPAARRGHRRELLAQHHGGAAPRRLALGGAGGGGRSRRQGDERPARPAAARRLHRRPALPRRRTRSDLQGGRSARWSSSSTARRSSCSTTRARSWPRRSRGRGAGIPMQVLDDIAEALEDGRPRLSRLVPQGHGHAVYEAVPFRSFKGEIIGVALSRLDPETRDFASVLGLLRAGRDGLGRPRRRARDNRRQHRRGAGGPDHPLQRPVRRAGAGRRSRPDGRCRECHGAATSRASGARRGATEVYAFAPLAAAPWGVLVRQDAQRGAALRRGRLVDGARRAPLRAHGGRLLLGGRAERDPAGQRPHAGGGADLRGRPLARDPRPGRGRDRPAGAGARQDARVPAGPDPARRQPERGPRGAGGGADPRAGRGQRAAARARGDRAATCCAR